MLQSAASFTPQLYANRFENFMSIDVEILTRGGADANIVQIMHPSQLMGYLTVVMAQKSMQVSYSPSPLRTPIHFPSFSRMQCTGTISLL